MLQKEPKYNILFFSKRPTVNQILSLPFIKDKITTLLSETIRKSEFSHTKLHGRNVVKEHAMEMKKYLIYYFK